MKLLVETTGSHQIYSPMPEQWVRADRPSVVRATVFIELHVANGQLKPLAQLSDEASDVAFVEAWTAAPDIAVEAFAAEFPWDKAAEKAPEPGPAKGARRGGRKQAEPQ